jgi:hypothetical protein
MFSQLTAEVSKCKCRQHHWRLPTSEEHASATHHGQERLLSTCRPNTFAQTCRSPFAFSLAVRRRTIHLRELVSSRYSIDERLPFVLWYATAIMLTEDLVANSDPCTKPSAFSWSRCILFTFVFLTFIPGGMILFFFLSNRPYGVQAASMVSYTAAVILDTFSKNRGMQRYLFHCPFVRPQLPVLARRHAYFLVALFALQTVVLQLRSHLSPF